MNASTMVFVALDGRQAQRAHRGSPTGDAVRADVDGRGGAARLCPARPCRATSRIGLPRRPARAIANSQPPPTGQPMTGHWCLTRCRESRKRRRAFQACRWARRPLRLMQFAPESSDSHDTMKKPTRTPERCAERHFLAAPSRMARRFDPDTAAKVRFGEVAENRPGGDASRQRMEEPDSSPPVISRRARPTAPGLAPWKPTTSPATPATPQRWVQARGHTRTSAPS